MANRTNSVMDRSGPSVKKSRQKSTLAQTPNSLRVDAKVPLSTSWEKYTSTHKHKMTKYDHKWPNMTKYLNITKLLKILKYTNMHKKVCDKNTNYMCKKYMHLSDPFRQL